MMGVLIRAALDGTEMIVIDASTYEDAVRMLGSIEGIGVVIVPTSATGLLDAYTEALCQHPGVKCLTVSASPQRADLFELRLLGTNVGRNDVVEAIRAAIAN